LSFPPLSLHLAQIRIDLFTKAIPMMV